MKMIFAILKHAVLAMQLEHDGSGLPVKFSGALLLVSVYSALTLATSANVSDDLLGLSFIVVIYLFVLRSQVIGLIILIGIITSTIAFILGLFGELSPLHLVMLTILEYLLVFGALVNAIKRYANLT
jgi:hypothetical protein